MLSWCYGCCQGCFVIDRVCSICLIDSTLIAGSLSARHMINPLCGLAIWYNLGSSLQGLFHKTCPSLLCFLALPLCPASLPRCSALLPCPAACSPSPQHAPDYFVGTPHAAAVCKEQGNPLPSEAEGDGIVLWEGLVPYARIAVVAFQVCDPWQEISMCRLLHMIGKPCHSFKSSLDIHNFLDHCSCRGFGVFGHDFQTWIGSRSTFLPSYFPCFTSPETSHLGPQTQCQLWTDQSRKMHWCWEHQTPCICVCVIMKLPVVPASTKQRHTPPLYHRSFTATFEFNLCFRSTLCFVWNFHHVSNRHCVLHEMSIIYRNFWVQPVFQIVIVFCIKCLSCTAISELNLCFQSTLRIVWNVYVSVHICVHVSVFISVYSSV